MVKEDHSWLDELLFHIVRMNNEYGKWSKISNTFLFLFSNKKLDFRAGIYKMLVRIANREDPDQTASSEAVWSGSALFVPFWQQLEFKILEKYKYEET